MKGFIVTKFFFWAYGVCVCLGSDVGDGVECVIGIFEGKTCSK